MGSSMLSDSVWTSTAVVALHSLALPLTLWFKPFCVLFAVFWLVYRAAQVLKKPLDELASQLGFDIPLTPTIDLASVKSDGALIHWNLPEKQKQKSSLKYEIHLNGTMIDAVSIHESAVTITGLQPGTFYVVRVALVTNHDFSSKSIPIRFRTKYASSGDHFVVAVDGHETDPDGPHEPVPRVRPYRGLKDISPALPLSGAAGTREGAIGLIPRRLTNGRRVSPSAAVEVKSESSVDNGEAKDGAETVQHLTEKLDAIRRETDEAERAAREEEEEERSLKEVLSKERDDLKTELNKKERASRDLKKEADTMGRLNNIAHNERMKQEKILTQKKLERQKLKDDMVRWEHEMVRMRADVESILQEKADHLATVSQQKEKLREEQAGKATDLQTLEIELQNKLAEIKELEETSLNHNSSDGADVEPNLVQQYQQDAEEERTWQMHRQALQQQYTMAYQKMESAKRFHAEQMRYLDSLRAERRRVEEVSQYASPPPTQDRLPRRGDSQRSRQPHRHSISDSPRLANFPVNQSPFSGSVTNIASGGFPAAPFLNIQNGMTISGPTDAMSMSDEEREKLTGGALMSPGAGAELIPADLFDSEIRMERVPPLPGLGALPGLAGLPGPSPPVSQDYTGQGPASPTSASSRSPSVFASPRASLHNLHMGSPDNALDADRRSIRSSRSTRAASGTGSRFSALFGMKPRAKTGPDDGPALGKANSMPRQDQVVAGLDSTGRKRNSSISGATTGAPYPNDGAGDVPGDSSAAAPSKRFGLFSRDKSGGWPSTFTSFGRRPVSPRPGSTHSNELPRPSMDSNRWGVDTWPSADATSGGNRSSPLAFGTGWNAPGQQQRLYGSRHPSRRPSVQYGATGPPEDILEDEDDDGSDMLDTGYEAQLAPIGTKPSKMSRKQADNAAALNPNAKDFKILFSGMKLSKSKDAASPAPGSSSRGDKVTTPGPSTTTANPGSSGNMETEDSPPISRRSRDTRDTHSLNTTESSIAAGESGRNSVDLVLTPSYTASDAPVPSPSLAGSSKESFMQKLTRKSSSSKFSLPTFRSGQREKSIGSPIVTAGPNGTPAPTFPPAAEEDEAEDGPMSASVGSFKESATSTTNRSSGRNWSNVLKLTKSSASKRSIDSPSLSGLSMTSGTDDGDVEVDGLRQDD